MKFVPYAYQEHCINRMIESPALGLILDMGLGKTAITLTAIDALMHDRFEVSRVLVIAPLRVAESVWANEAGKWDHLRHLRVVKMLGSELQRRAALAHEADIYVINRENVVWLVAECGRHWPFDMVVIDELSSFKSSKAKRFRALRKVRPAVRRIVGLTGTPAPNGLIDLWSQIYLLDCGERLGLTLTKYRDTYFRPGRRNGNVVYNWALKPDAERAIYEKLEGLCVSMSAKDYLEMPARIDRMVPVPLPPAARLRYARLEREYVLALEEHVVTAGNAAVLGGKLLQLANGAVYDESGRACRVHDAKLEALDDLLEAACGQPVLVFYAFRHDLDRLLQRYPQARTLDRPEDVDAWNRGETELLLAHPAGAGHGLNLQDGGHIVVWFGLTWSLELYQQANARLHRQGQRRTVIVHHLVAQGTMDEIVMEALMGKADTQERFLDAVKARIEKYRGV